MRTFRHGSPVPIADIEASFDHSISESYQRGRNSEAQRLCCPDVNHQLIFRWQLNWKIARLLALKDAVDVTGGAPRGDGSFFWPGPWRGRTVPESSPRAALAAGAPAQPWRRQRRTAAAGHCAVKLITRTRDPFERSISACEQISSSISATSISVVGRHCKVLGISPGQMRHAEPSLSSTRWLLSCLLICIADLPYSRSEPTNPATNQQGPGKNQFQLVDTVKRTPAHAASLTGSER